jgi:hypothetical protein
MRSHYADKPDPDRLLGDEFTLRELPGAILTDPAEYGCQRVDTKLTAVDTKDPQAPSLSPWRQHLTGSAATPSRVTGKRPGILERDVCAQGSRGRA